MVVATVLIVGASASSGALAAQNGRIAFTRTNGGPHAKPRAAIWTIAAAGTREQRLTASGLDMESPSFSPDGKLIVYTRYNCLHKSGVCLKRGDIWTMHADGSDQRQLTSTRRISEIEPTWSPDGSQIAYAIDPTYYGVSEAGIWVINSNGRNPRRLTHVGSDPAWSPDGATIAFAADNNIFTVPAAGGSTTNLTHNPDHNQAPSWSPDGSQIVFTRSNPAPQTDLWIMNANGSHPHPLTNTRSLNESAPAWSPDGNWVAYSSTNTYAQGLANNQLYLIHPNGTNRHAITHSHGQYPIWNQEPSWQPR